LTFVLHHQRDNKHTCSHLAQTTHTSAMHAHKRHTHRLCMKSKRLNIHPPSQPMSTSLSVKYTEAVHHLLHWKFYQQTGLVCEQCRICYYLCKHYALEMCEILCDKLKTYSIKIAHSNNTLQEKLPTVK